ncbi:GAP family protein [Mycolicibacterium novocastrense]|nr:GAP family protein [Mycolicibacterium novocastrense]
MWSSVLVLAFLSAINPVHLGLILLVISRPRTVQNLLAFLIGSLTGCIPFLVIPLILVHATPMFDSLTRESAPGSSSTVPQVQVVGGGLALVCAALLAVRVLTRRRQRAPVSGRSGAVPTLLLDSNPSAMFSRLLGRASDAPSDGATRGRALFRRLRDGWENGSLWVSYALGLAFGGPQPDAALLVVAIIVTSGAVLGVQIGAAAVFIVGMLAVVEAALISYFITPVRTRAVLERLHDWAATRRLQILAAMFAVVGVTLLASGTGVI